MSRTCDKLFAFGYCASRALVPNRPLGRYPLARFFSLVKTRVIAASIIRIASTGRASRPASICFTYPCLLEHFSSGQFASLYNLASQIDISYQQGFDCLASFSIGSLGSIVSVGCQ
jgi:hypothetical protein